MHIVMQDHHCSSPEHFHHPKLKPCPVNSISPFPLPLSPWQPLVRFLSLVSLTPPAASRRWGPAVLVLLCLASVTGHTVFKVHPGGSVGHFKVEWRSGVQTCRSLLADGVTDFPSGLGLPNSALLFTMAPPSETRMSPTRPSAARGFVLGILAPLRFHAVPSPGLSGLLSEFLSVGNSSVLSVFKSFNDEIQIQQSICNMTGFKEK